MKTRGCYLSVCPRNDSKVEVEKKSNDVPIILWNHRWEYDKNPKSFFEALYRLEEEQIEFQLIVIGERYKKYPEIFDQAKVKLEKQIIQFGFVESRDDYLKYLGMFDVVQVRSNHDIFGISAIEAIAAGCKPLLPNRLAFPEHLSDSNWYYENDEDLYRKLKKEMIENGEPSDSIRDQVMKYDWDSIIKRYETYFIDISNFS